MTLSVEILLQHWRHLYKLYLSNNFLYSHLITSVFTKVSTKVEKMLITRIIKVIHFVMQATQNYSRRSSITDTLQTYLYEFNTLKILRSTVLVWSFLFPVIHISSRMSVLKWHLKTFYCTWIYILYAYIFILIVEWLNDMRKIRF